LTSGILFYRPGVLSTNRGNDLLVELLQFRFPHIFDDGTLSLMRDWLSADVSERKVFERKHEVDDSVSIQRLETHVEKHSSSYPMAIGEDWTPKQKSQMALFLANSHMVDFDDTHCAPLPVDLFRFPRAIGTKSDFEDLSDFVEIKPSELLSAARRS